MSEPELLAIVPARGGSRGLPGKNLRLINGKPLVLRTCETLRAAGLDPVVSSDDSDILALAAAWGYRALERPQQYSGSDVPLANVALHATRTLGWQDDVGVFQPTSPGLTVRDVREALDAYRAGGLDSLETATIVHHQHYLNGEALMPKVNRQDMPDNLIRPNGACHLFPTSLLEHYGTMAGDRHRFHIVTDAIDVDTGPDLAAARAADLADTVVVFRCIANRQVGAGHLYRCMRLAQEVVGPRVRFMLIGPDQWAVDLLDAHGWLLAHDIMEFERGIVVNDTLDTDEAVMRSLRAWDWPVVCLEDLGYGARQAEAVVNDMYPPPDLRTDYGTFVAGPRIYRGGRYAVLRPEMACLPPFEVREEADRVLLAFGGSDPARLTERVRILLADVQVSALLGPGYQGHLPLGTRRADQGVLTEMREHDLAITSCGRTIYECAAVGIPTVALAANARESTHSHIGAESGVVYLGMHAQVTDQQISETVRRMLADADLRREVSGRLRQSIDGKGARRVVRLLEDLLEGL